MQVVRLLESLPNSWRCAEYHFQYFERFAGASSLDINDLPVHPSGSTRTEPYVRKKRDGVRKKTRRRNAAGNNSTVKETAPNVADQSSHVVELPWPMQYRQLKVCLFWLHASLSVLT